MVWGEVVDSVQSDFDSNVHQHESEDGVHDDQVSVPESDQDIEGAERPRNFSLIKRHLVVQGGAGWICSKR